MAEAVPLADADAEREMLRVADAEVVAEADDVAVPLPVADEVLVVREALTLGDVELVGDTLGVTLGDGAWQIIRTRLPCCSAATMQPVEGLTARPASA